MFAEMSGVRMGESQQVQSLDSAMTNVIFPLSKFLDHKIVVWKFLKEWAFLFVCFAPFPPPPKITTTTKKSIHLFGRLGKS